MLTDVIGDLWGAVALDSALTAMVEGAGSQVTLLLPIGITLMFTLAVPKIVKRIIGTFI